MSQEQCHSKPITDNLCTEPLETSHSKESCCLHNAEFGSCFSSPSKIFKEHGDPHRENLCGLQEKFQEIFEILLDLRHQTQVAHWIVGGEHFSCWHEMYARHYDQLNNIMDDYVEMILMHNLTIKDCHSYSNRLIRSHCSIGSKKQMFEIMEDLKHLIVVIEKLLVHEPRMCIQDTLTQSVRTLEKQAWFYKNSLM